jgi:hypothetical protein
MIQKICEHCEGDATLECTECGSMWCEKCIDHEYRECLTCGAKLEAK